jgi:peptidoglycan/LPS O-acetylase OafA/YrhL
MKRAKALDVVRGVAILIVLIWHYLPRDPTAPPILIYPTQLFWSGVDLFFVLSGFLIGGILLRNKKSKHYFGVFYIRRAARIIPLYILLLIGFGLVLYFHPPSIRETYKHHLPFWSYLTFTQNFYYATFPNFIDPWVDVTWSLAVEEQFYIFLSILIKNISRRNLSIVSIILILLAPVLRSFSTFMAAYVLPLQRADSLMLGVLLALIWNSEAGKSFLYRYSRIFKWLFIPLILGAAFLSYKGIQIGDPFGHFWLALLYGDIVVLASVSNIAQKGTFFNDKILEWLGLRSYCIYLFHLPLLIATSYFFRRLTGIDLNRWLLALVCLCLVVGLAECSYRLIEKPIIELGHRYKYE